MKELKVNRWIWIMIFALKIRGSKDMKMQPIGADI